MELSQLSALALFAFVSTFTPGPNNIMLMTSGANVGFVRTIPHMLGITLGFAVMVMLIGVGLMGLFHSYPLSHQILKYLSLSYLVYLATKIAFSGKASERKDFKPMSFFASGKFSVGEPKRLDHGADGSQRLQHRESMVGVGFDRWGIHFGQSAFGQLLDRRWNSVTALAHHAYPSKEL